MAEESSANGTNDLINGVTLPSLPVLPNSLNSFYNSLGVFNRGVFIKIFRYVWRYVHLTSIKHNDLISMYWLVYGPVDLSGIPSYSFALLSYIYYITKQGKNYIHSDIIYNSGVLPGLKIHTIAQAVTNLARSGYLMRSTKDPGQPYSHRAQHNRQPVYIRLTPAGLRVIEDMTKQINKILLNTSLNDLTGANKKPG